MRVQVNLNDELVVKLDEYAKAIGMSRSSLCAYFIGQGIYGVTSAKDCLQGVIDAAAKQNQITPI